MEEVFVSTGLIEDVERFGDPKARAAWLLGMIDTDTKAALIALLEREGKQDERSDA